MAQKRLQTHQTAPHSRPVSPMLTKGEARSISHSRQPTTHSLDSSLDSSTSAFIRKVLFPSQQDTASTVTKEDSSISQVLPPLTSSNEVDLQLYALIAIFMQDLVYAWYSKFTSDRVFVDEILKIIAHCTRTLEERARNADLEALLLDDIPALIDAHISAYNTATAASAEDVSHSEKIYHALRPHPALDRTVVASSDQGLEEVKEEEFRPYCQILAQGIFAVLLPTEDLQNPALRALVSEATGDLIIGNLIGVRFAEPSFLYDSIRKAAEIVQPRLGFELWTQEEPEVPLDRLSRFGLLSKRNRDLSSLSRKRTLSEWLNLMIDYCVLAFIILRTLVATIVASSSLPARKTAPPASQPTSPIAPDQMTSTYATPKPLLEYQLWRLFAHLTSIADRMPWMTGLFALVDTLLLQSPRGLGAYDSRIDRYVLLDFEPVPCNLTSYRFPNLG